MTEAHVRGSRPSDIDYMMSKGLRDQDAKELEALGVDPRPSLEHGLKHSTECLTVVVDSSPCAMFGVVPHEGRFGIIWLLGTDDLFKVSRRFLRESKHWLEHITKNYDLVGNVVHRGNTVSIRWLSWLGFTFLAEAKDLIEFARIKHVLS